MTATFDTVLQDALRLPLEDRSRIASRLIESVDEDDDIELSPAWRTEINRRVDAIRNGTAKLIEHDEVMAGVRQKLAQQRAVKQA
jgi:putative addiction module component (TIGR02574 family)